jgi:hypothetical protein
MFGTNTMQEKIKEGNTKCDSYFEMFEEVAIHSNFKQACLLN